MWNNHAGKRVGSRATFNSPHEDRTDEDGVHVLEAVRPGAWIAFARSGDLGGRAGPVTIEHDADEKTIEVVLDEVVARRHLRVTLLDAATGAPVADAARPSVDAERLDGEGSRRGTLRRGDEGIVEVGDLAPGRWRLVVTDEVHATAVVEAVVREDVRVTEVEVRMRAGTALKGRAVNPDGSFPGGWYDRVEIVRDDVEVASGYVDEDDGSFEVTGLPAGVPFTAVVVSTGWTRTRFELSPGATDVVLRAPGPPTGEVIVRDPKGEPVYQALVELTDAAGRRVRAHTGGGGRLGVLDALVGPVQVRVYSGRTSYGSARLALDAWPPPGGVVEVRLPYDESSPDARGKMRVRGRLIDADGEPVYGVHVREVGKWTGSGYLFTEKDGRFDVRETGLRATLRFEHGDFAPAERTFEGRDGEVIDGVEVVLRPGVAVGGHVGGPAGSEVTSVVAERAGAALARATPSAAGRFDLGRLAVGPLRLRLLARDGTILGEQELDLAPGDDWTGLTLEADHR